MIAKSVQTTEIAQTPHQLDVRKLYDKESAQVMHITLHPGQALKPHITPVDVFFYVLEGTPEIQVGDEFITFEKDTLIESPKDIIHCLYNKSEAIARILVVKAPKPGAPAKLV